MGRCNLKSFNMQMNIAKAIGITAIVGGHVRWEIFGALFPNYSWHVPLFFFIAGYFFNINKELLSVIKKSICKYLGWFYSYHFFFGGMTVLVYLWFDRLYGKMPSLKTLTISPIDSTPFWFNVPNWFLYQLAISLVGFAIIMFFLKKIKEKYKYIIMTLFFIICGVTAVLLAKDNFQASHGVMKVIIKTLITLFYIYSGWLYRNKLETKVQFNAKWLCIVLAAQVILLRIFSNGYHLDVNQAKLFHNMSPLIVPFTGIYLVLFMSKLLAPLVKEGSIIDKIGRNTLHIMANHAFVIFLIELCIFAIDGIPYSELPKGLLFRYYKINKYQFLYTFGSLVICTYIGEFINFSSRYIKNKLSATPRQ